jgi:hypothetical protein
MVSTLTLRKAIGAFIQKQEKRIYIKRGASPPKGVALRVGKRGGRFYTPYFTKKIAVNFTPASAEQFSHAVSKAPRQSFLSHYSLEELKNFKTFLSSDGLVGFALTPKNDLVNVFNASGVKGAGEEAVIQAIVNGAETLDCFDRFLPKYYARFGFEENSRVNWDDQYAPPDWDYQSYGRPNVVFMHYRGISRNADEIRRNLKAF